VLAWDLYNESSLGQHRTGPSSLLREVFRWARAARPQQPLTLGLWGNSDEPAGHMRLICGREILESSDVVSFHNYNAIGSSMARGVPGVAPMVEELSKAGRPLICTEWLCRWMGSVPATHLPWLKDHGVGCLHWGWSTARPRPTANCCR
jgi:hypothetical protein